MLKKLCTLLCSALLISCSKPSEPTRSLRVGAVGLNAAALADDGQHAVVGSLHHGISLWRTDDSERLFDWTHKSKVDTTMLAADISPDGAWAVTADERTLALWEIQTGAGPRFWQAPGEITSVQLSTGGSKALLALSNHTAVLFDIRRGGIIHTLPHNGRVRSIALSDDGGVAVTGSEDYTAIAWNLTTGQAISKVRHQDDVQLVALSADGELALSMSQYDRAVVWSTADGKILGQVPLAAERLKRGLRFTSARFSKDKRWLLTGRPDQLVTLWQLPGLEQKAQWQIPAKKPWKPSRGTILDVAFGADDAQFFAVASDGFIYWLQMPEPDL